MFVAAAVNSPAAYTEHMDDSTQEALQQIAATEPGKSIVSPQDVGSSVGAELDRWILAAQDEHDKFRSKEAVMDASAEDIRQYGCKPVPMINVWAKTDTDMRKMPELHRWQLPGTRPSRPALDRAG